MREAGIALVVCLVMLTLAPLALAQDAEMVLDDKEIGVHQRPLVVFTHEKHASNIECAQCHHDYDQYGNNRGGDGQPCATCHGSAEHKDLPPLTEAFHLQCKGCHHTLHDAGKPTGPILCGECHVRR